jgi:hypothetical protein
MGGLVSVAPTLQQVPVGGVVWALARGYWRESRVLATSGTPERPKVWVAFRLGATSAWRRREQELPLSKIRLEKPPTRALSGVPAPEIA